MRGGGRGAVNLEAQCGQGCLGDSCWKAVCVETEYSGLQGRSHGASATGLGSTILGVADTCCTKWVQDPLTVTGSANTHFRSHPIIAG